MSDLLHKQAHGGSSAIQGVLAEVSPVKIGVASTFDAGSQSILVEVELYYTGESPAAEDRLHVALTRDHIIGYQQDHTNGAQANYDHRHALRDYFTTIDGDAVTTTAAGTLVNRMYGLEVLATWSLADLDVVAFIGDAEGEVYQVRSVDADGGATVGICDDEDRFRGPGHAFPVPAADLVVVPFHAEAGGGCSMCAMPWTAAFCNNGLPWAPLPLCCPWAGWPMGSIPTATTRVLHGSWWCATDLRGTWPLRPPMRSERAS